MAAISVAVRPKLFRMDMNSSGVIHDFVGNVFDFEAIAASVYHDMPHSVKGGGKILLPAGPARRRPWANELRPGGHRRPDVIEVVGVAESGQVGGRLPALGVKLEDGEVEGVAPPDPGVILAGPDALDKVV
ncbi:MAG: hypothetical protein QW838_04155 [Candidatus Nitrosotenuis sp.]